MKYLRFIFYPIVLLSLLMPCRAFTQTDLKEAPLYTLLHEVVIKEFNFLEKEVGEKTCVLFSNVVFEQVQRIDMDGQIYAIIKPVKILKKRQTAAEEKTEKPIELLKYFLVPSIDLEENLQNYTPRKLEMRVGISNIPVKLYTPRDGRPFDFSSSSVSLGPTLGFSHQISESKNDFWMNYLFSMSFTMVTPRQDDFSSEEFDGNTLSALSPAIGIALNSNGAEFGIFAGKDYLPGSASRFWTHNGQTWLSISIGISFSTVGEE